MSENSYSDETYSSNYEEEEESSLGSFDESSKKPVLIQNTLFIFSQTARKSDFTLINKHLVLNVIAPYLEEIKEYAFRDFNMRFMYAPNLKIIRKSAFYYCLGLFELVAENINHIEQSAFSNCDSLVRLNFKKAEFIDSSAFSMCVSMPTFVNQNLTVFD